MCTRASFSSVFKNVFVPLIVLTPCPKENISNVLNKLQLLSQIDSVCIRFSVKPQMKTLETLPSARQSIGLTLC
jgi:hypothetical protein